MKCDYCGESYARAREHMCRRCGLCLKRCHTGCRDIPNVLPGVEWKRGVVNTLDRPMGLEVEIGEWGGVGDWMPEKFGYIVDRDGSVRPSEAEMVVSPLSGDGFLLGVGELWKILVESKASMNDTCGLHVHVGALDLSEWEVLKVLRLYIGMEEEIYGVLVDPYRVASGCRRYAKKLDSRYKTYVQRMRGVKDLGDLKDLMYRLLYQTGSEDYERIKRYKESKVVDGYHGQLVGVRYFGLNIHSWMHRGTLEWRMKEGTLELEELVNWPLFCAWFVEVGAKMPGSKLENMKKGGLVRLAKEYMPGSIGNWVEKKAAKVAAAKAAQE